MVHRSPKVMKLAIDPHEHLINVPSPYGIAAPRNSSLSDLRREYRTEVVPPVADSFMADINVALVKEIFDIAKR